MIRSFRHKGLEAFFRSGSKRGVQPSHAALDASASPRDMDLPGWRLHLLAGALAGHWPVWVNGNWRLTFKFEGQDAELVDYQDYH
jgi:proteic killer suppression protein